ncbi:MAG: hypothetical protein ACE366_26180 [Bradymonadia bacterium]
MNDYRRVLMGLGLLGLVGCGSQRAIIGQLVDEQGDPIKGIEVKTQPATDFVKTTRLGVFNINRRVMENGGFEGLEDTTYTIVINAIGYEPLKLPVTVEGGEVNLGPHTLKSRALNITETPPDVTPHVGDNRGNTGKQGI